jgi:hypothetical protein
MTASIKAWDCRRREGSAPEAKGRTTTSTADKLSALFSGTEIFQPVFSVGNSDV